MISYTVLYIYTHYIFHMHVICNHVCTYDIIYIYIYIYNIIERYLNDTMLTNSIIVFICSLYIYLQTMYKQMFIYNIYIYYLHVIYSSVFLLVAFFVWGVVVNSGLSFRMGIVLVALPFRN